MNNIFWKRLEEYPPALVRLLAKEVSGPALTTQEIAERSGLQAQYVLKLSRLLSWERVPVGIMRRFTAACNVDFFSRSGMKRLENYRRGTSKDGKRKPPAFDFLRKSPEWETVLKPLLAEVIRARR